MYAEADQAGGEAGAIDLFGGDHREAPVQAQSTVRLGSRCIEHAELAGTRPDLPGYSMVLFPLFQPGSALLGQEASHSAAKLLVLMFKQGTRDHRGALLGSIVLSPCQATLDR
ncbi:hypothetical protein D9M71_319360 [compost metagenome]